MEDKGNLLDSADLDQDRGPWKYVWLAGYGVGSIDSLLSTQELVAQLKQSISLLLKPLTSTYR